MMDQGSALANWCAYRAGGGGGGDGETSWDDKRDTEKEEE